MAEAAFTKVPDEESQNDQTNENQEKNDNVVMEMSPGNEPDAESYVGRRSWVCLIGFQFP